MKSGVPIIFAYISGATTVYGAVNNDFFVIACSMLVMAGCGALSALIDNRLKSYEKFIGEAINGEESRKCR